MHAVGRRLLSGLVVGLMLVTALAVLFSGRVAAGNDIALPTGSSGSATPFGGSPGQVTGDEDADALSKIDAGLQDAALRPQKTNVDILLMTTDLAGARRVATRLGASFVLDEAVDGTSFRGSPGDRASTSFIAKPLTVPEKALLEIAKLPSTISISKALDPKLFEEKGSVDYQEWTAIRPLVQERLRQLAKEGQDLQGGPSKPVLTDYGTAVVTGSQDVKNTYGITGSDVNLMVLDTGTDFAHPAFSYENITMPGVHHWATVEDPLSDWYGWPIMIDSPSLELWFAQWDAGLPPYPLGYSFGESTWFADTVYEGQLVGTPLDITVDGDPVDWDVAHQVATDPVEVLNTLYDLTTLYVSGGQDAPLDVVGWFFGFDTVPLITTSEYVIYVNVTGPGTAGFDTLYDNNLPTVGQIVDAATAWETTETVTLPPNTAMLPGTLSLYLDDGTTFVEGVDYTFSMATGIATFMQTLYPGHILYADYMYGFTNVMNALFSTRNIDAGSTTVYLNGAVWAPANYVLDEAMGTIAFNAALAPGDLVEADYTYNPGGDLDPVYGAAVTSTELPEMVFYWQPGMLGEPDVYYWDGLVWDGPYALSSEGGESSYSALNNFAEFFFPKGSSNDPWTIRVEMYSGDTTGLVDTVPSDAAPLSTFVDADSGYLPYWHGLNGWYTKRVAPDLGNNARINRNYHLDLTNPQQVSLSGTYHLGVSPDDILTAIWGERVGLLVVDPNTAGVYDTIFVDVDDDHSFADENAVTQNSPAVWQDITGDGIPDISGGLLYWMPPPSVAQPVESFTGPTLAGATSVNLSNGNVAVDFLEGYPGIDVTGPFVNLNGSPLYWGDTSTDGVWSYTMDLQTGEVFFWVWNETRGIFEDNTNLTAADLVEVTYNTGVPVPYSQAMSADEGMMNFIPENGDIALFYFDFGGHGTSTASAAAGKPFGNFGGVFDVFGTAEDAKLIGGNFAGATAALDFAGRGYDGVPGTGDEAQIVSNSWGYIDTDTIAHSGWDANSRYVQYLSDIYPETTYMFAGSNEGYGYGTLASPVAAPDTIAVSAATMMNYRRLYSMLGVPGFADLGPVGCWPVLSPGDPCGPWGDLVDFGARGPSGLGQPRPDVIAPGAFGFAAEPLNFYFEGLDAWNLFSGTSWATPVAAGVAALVAESYYDSHGSWPTNEQMKEFLMSGANDHGFDSLQQGAGFVNASRSVQLANIPALNGGGLSVTPSSWVPGGYPTPADDHVAFVNLLRPGESDTDTFTLTNHGTGPMTATVSDGAYVKTDSYSWEYIHQAGGGEYWTFAGTGGVVDTRYTGTGGGFTFVANDFPAGSYATAEFIIVHLTVADLDRIVANGDSMLLGVEIYQWTDVDDDGINDNSPERNRISYLSGGQSDYNVMKNYLHHPAARFDNGTSVITEGFVIRTRDFAPAIPIPFNITIEFYERADWSWVTTTQPPANIPSGATATFDATATVPAGTLPGSYQGVLLVTAAGQVIVMPTLINVPYTGFPAHLGGVAPTTSLYENGAFRGQGGAQYTLGGDLRYFFVETAVDTTRPDRVMLYELDWTNQFTDAEIYAAASDPYDAGSFEEAQPDVYGPHSLVTVAASKGNRGSQDTNTGYQEFITGPLQTGLMLVTVESLALKGDDVQEEFSIDVGMMETKKTVNDVPTTLLAGSAPVTVWANVPLHGGLGASVTEVLEDTFTAFPVPSYPYPGGDFITYLWGAPSVHSELLPAGMITLKYTWNFYAGAGDVDFGVFYDGPTCDGAYTPGDAMGGTQAATGSNPEIWSADFPPAGCYWIHAAGFTGSGLFDEVRGISRIGVSAFTAENCPTATVAPLTLTGCDVAWDFPGSTPSSMLSGTLFLSPGYAPFALAQKVTMNIRYDTAALRIADMIPADGSVTSDTMPDVVANVYDDVETGKAPYFEGQIDWRTATLWIDGMDVTQLATVLAPYNNPSAPPPEVCLGYCQATVHLVPTAPLADGSHTATLQILDYAGNVAVTSWSWTVDTTGPSLAVTSPSSAMSAQTTATTTFSGTTDPGATVALEVEGTSVALTVDPQGSFSGSLSLSLGENAVDVVARDALGNPTTQSFVVLYDTAAPALTNLATSVGTVTNADAVTITGDYGEPVTLTVNGVAVPVLADGTWSTTVSLAEGTNVIVLVATDAAGRTATETVTRTRILAPPAIAAGAELPDGTAVAGVITNVDDNMVHVHGDVTAAPGTPAANEIRTVTVNGQIVPVTRQGTTQVWDFELADQPLNVGANTFVVQATDTAGNVATSSVVVTYSPLLYAVQKSYNTTIWAVVAVVLLVVGFLVGMMMAKGRPPEAPTEAPEEAPPAPEGPSPEELPPMAEDQPPQGGAP